MAVIEQVPEVRYVANGVTVIFPFAFYVPTIDDLVVQVDGVAQTGGFSVSGLGQAGGGQITFGSTPVDTAVVTIRRETTLERLTDYQQAGDFRSRTVNLDFDRPILAIQEMSVRASRALLVAVGERGLELPPAGTNPNRVLGTDADGNLTFALPGSGTQLAMDLLGDTGAGLFGFKGSSQQNRTNGFLVLGEMVPSLARFKRAGESDYTAAAQRALTEGTRLILPGGTDWRISGPLTIPNSGTLIKGDGKACSLISVLGHTFDLFTVTAAGNVELKDFGVTNFGAAPTGTNYWFLRANNAYAVHARALALDRLHSGMTFGVLGSTTGGSTCGVWDCDIKNFAALTGIGVAFAGKGEIRNVVNVNIIRPGSTVASANGFAGVYVTGGVAINLDNVQVDGAGTPLLVAASADGVAHIVMTSFWADSSAGDGVFLDGAAGTITGVRMTESWSTSNGGNGIRARGAVRNVKINGNNQIEANGQNGLVVEANAFIAGMQIQSNSIGGNGGSGIAIGDNNADYMISDNAIGLGSVAGPNAANGITIGTGCDAFLIAANNLRGNTGQALVNGSASTSTDSRIVDNIGYEPGPPGAITVTASPFTYRAGASAENIFGNPASGGSTSLIKINSVGVQQPGATPWFVRLEPNQTLEVTYTGTVAMVRVLV